MEIKNRYNETVSLSIKTVVPNRCNKLPELLALQLEGKAFDFLANCRTYRLSDMEIVARWEKDFKAKNLPYAVCHQGQCITIWKEKYTTMEDK